MGKWVSTHVCVHARVCLHTHTHSHTQTHAHKHKQRRPEVSMMAKPKKGKKDEGGGKAEKQAPGAALCCAVLYCGAVCCSVMQCVCVDVRMGV